MATASFTIPFVADKDSDFFTDTQPNMYFLTPYVQPDNHHIYLPTTKTIL